MNGAEVQNSHCYRTKPLILSVDDEPCIGRVVQLKLRNAGFDVERASSGAEGLERFIATRPDVLITDVKMPGMSGIELCRRCEEYRGAWPFLIVVLTSQLDDETRAWLEQSENHRYLPKPFSPREILRTIEEYLAERKDSVGPLEPVEAPEGNADDTCEIEIPKPQAHRPRPPQVVLKPSAKLKRAIL